MDTEQKRELVLNVARARFQRFGVKKTTVDEISRDAGISKKTLYELFKNKEDLFVAVFIREALGNRAFIVDKVRGIASPRDKVTQLLRGAVKRITEQRFMIQVLADEENLYVPYLQQQFQLQVEQEILNLITPILEEGMRTGEFRPMEPRTVAYFIFKLFQTFTYAKTDSIDGNDRDLDELIAFIIMGITP